MLNRFSFFQMKSIKKSNRVLLLTTIILFILAIFSFNSGKEYTSLALLFFLLSILFDMVWGAKIITNRLFLYYFGLVSIFTFIFNGYLTWRPIVTYNSVFQLDLRVFTIPIEDFLFGYALLIICTSIFEKLLNRTVSGNA
jgi:lycopene cyclase domain-containing protein